MKSSIVAAFGVLLGLAVPATAADAPKRGGTLNFMIPADSPNKDGAF